LKENHGCGARVLYYKLREKYSRFSERDVNDIVFGKRYYQQQYPLFLNKLDPKPVTANSPGHRWQIDFINMTNDSVRFNGGTYNYILQVVDVYSRYIMPRPLKNKSSKEVAKALKDIILEHMLPKLCSAITGKNFRDRT
jgi:transposase InsO family protein